MFSFNRRRARRRLPRHTQAAHQKHRRLFLEPLEPRQMLTSIPVAINDPLYSTNTNTDLVISTVATGVANNDFDADGNSLTASVVANPASGTLVSFSSNGTFTYRPNTSFTGIDTFTYKVNDGTNDSNTATVTIAVGGNFGPRTNQDDAPLEGMLTTGGLELAQPLTLGHQLVYRSDAHAPRPVVVVETSLRTGSSVPDSIDAQLTFGGIVGSTVSYNNTGLSAGEALRFALQVDASSLATGYYDYTLTLTAWFGASSVSRAYTGKQAVVNRAASEFGNGWWWDGLDRLYTSAAGALLVEGDGDTQWFAANGTSYHKAPGDTTFSTLVKNGDNTYTLTSKYGDKRNFSTTGLLTSRVDTNNNTVSYTYTDADGDSVTDELWKVTDPFSRVNTLTYTSGKLTSFADQASKTTTLTQTSGKLTRVTHPDPDGVGALAAPETDYVYDGTTNLIVTHIDALDYETDYEYDATSLRLSRIVHPDANDWELVPYQTYGLKTGTGNDLVDPADAIGQYTDGRGKIWKFKTDRFGNVIYAKDPLNNVTLTERDPNGLPFRLTEADPDGAGSATSPITKYGYNSSGDLVKQYLPDGNALTWTYHTTHHLPLTFVNELNKTWTYTYDSYANRLTEVDPLNNTWTYTYTTRGFVASITEPDPDGAGGQSASVTSFTYDTNTGTLTTITNPGSTGTKTFTYNSADLPLTMTDELSHTWSTVYDNLQRVTSQTAPDPDGGGSQTSAVTSYTYNANGWLTEVVDALGNDTDYTYNNRGFVTQVQQSDPDGAGSLTRPTTTYTYDAMGNVLTEGQWNWTGGGAISYTYDDVGRLTSTRGPVSSQSGKTWTYDNLGRVTKVEDTAGAGSSNYYTKYTYNSRSFVTSKILSKLEFSNMVDGPTTTYTYDAAGQLLNETDALGYVTFWTYDDRGLVTKLTEADPDGTGGGLVSPITTYAYDNVGRNTSVTNPLGRVTSYAYDSRNRLTTIIEPDPDGGGSATSPVTTYAYNNASLVTSVTDPLSRVTSYTYDNANRLLTVTAPDPDGGGSLTSPVTTYAYNKMDSVTSITDPLGNVTTFAYDNLQRRTSMTQPDPDGGGSQTSPVTTYVYGAQGLSKITDALSHDTTFGYDSSGRQTTVTNHQSKTTTTAYDVFSRVTSVTTPDPDGAGSQTASVTSYEYNHWFGVSKITDPRNGNTEFTYDVIGQLTNLRDASSNDTSWTYDGLGRVTAETNELNKTRTFAYDVAGNLLRQTDRLNRTTRFSYDNLDRVTDEKWIDGGTVPSGSSATTTQGGPHNEVQRVGFTGAVTGNFTLTFDGQTTANIAHGASASDVRTALENLSNIGAGDVAVTQTVNQADAEEWEITFQGALGGTNVAQITINTAGLQYTPTGSQSTTQQGSASNSEVQTVTISNATGGTFRLTFGTEQTSDLAYNASASTVDSALDALTGIENVSVTGNAGGPYTITFGGSQSNINVAQITVDVTYLTSGTVARTISYAYDAASQLTSTSDTDSSYSYTYDNLGRVTSETQNLTGLTPSIVFAHTYNANSKRLSLSATIGGTADFKNDYTYDNLSRMTQVIQQAQTGGNTVAGKRVDLAYNALGQFTSLTRYQSTGTSNLVATTTFAYDTLNRLTDLDHKQNTTNLHLYDYAYDAMDRITSITSSIDGVSAFTYDKETQLTAADHASPITDESFSYDATGNRTMTGYTVTTNNRTTADGTYTYQYDDEGNRTRRTKNSDSSYEEYDWDHRNRLTKVTFKNSGGTVLKTVEYKYDTFNRWIRRVYDADGPGAGAATNQFWVYDARSINPSLQFDGTAVSNLDHRYLWGPVVDQVLTDEDVSSLSSAGNVLWALADHLGTVRDIADLNEGTGVTTVTNHRLYDSFGNLKSETNSAVDVTFGFSGKPFDDVTGLQNNWQRWYDAALAQWLSEDPIGFSAGDSNLRRYVANDTVSRADSTGLVGENIIVETVNGVVVKVIVPYLGEYATLEEAYAALGIDTWAVDRVMATEAAAAEAALEQQAGAQAASAAAPTTAGILGMEVAPVVAVPIIVAGSIVLIAESGTIAYYDIQYEAAEDHYYHMALEHIYTGGRHTPEEASRLAQDEVRVLRESDLSFYQLYAHYYYNTFLKWDGEW